MQNHILAFRKKKSQPLIFFEKVRTPNFFKKNPLRTFSKKFRGWKNFQNFRSSKFNLASIYEEIFFGFLGVDSGAPLSTSVVLSQGDVVRGPEKNSRSHRTNNFLSKKPKISGIGLGSSELECAPRAWFTEGGVSKINTPD